jgi:hypothetical protein
MPPSLHPDTGRPYRWDHRPVAELPPNAIAAIRPPVRVHRPISVLSTLGRDRQAAALVRTVQAAPEKKRNDTLYWAARRTLEEGHGERLFDELERAALSAGLTTGEITRTLNSARDAGAV